MSTESCTHDACETNLGAAGAELYRHRLLEVGALGLATVFLLAGWWWHRRRSDTAEAAA